MKWTPLILPVIALGAISFWIHSQRVALASAEKERSALFSNSRVSRGSAPRKDDAPAKAENPPARSTDWQKTAGELQRLLASQNDKERKGIQRFLDQFEAMSPAEIVAVLDGIAGEKWESGSKAGLESMLINSLVKKSPELALTRFTDQLSKTDFRYNHLLQEALKNWAENDLPKATAWLDDSIKNGVFDSSVINRTDPVWLAYEAALIEAALGRDLSAASKRVEGLPPRMRGEVLLFPLAPKITDPQEQIDFGKLCRQFLDEEKMGTVIDWMSSNAVARDGYVGVTGFMDRFEMTPAERASVANKVAIFPLGAIAASRKVTIEDIDKVREWAASQGSKKIESITGSAIGSVAGSPATGMAAAFEMIEIYHARSGSDALLAGFLGWPVVHNNKAESQELLQRIRNEKVRAQVLRDFQ